MESANITENTNSFAGLDNLDKISVIDWNKLFLPYEQAVSELELKFQNIARGYRRMGEYSPIEMVYGRVKSAISIIDKARRKNVQMSDIEQHIEDIAGVRIVTKFVEDIARVVLLIRERDGKDITIVQEKDYVSNTKSSGYRSYHIIIKYPIYTSLGYREIYAELQIRTLSMNFWATIEHSMRYKYHNNMPEDMQTRLKSCSEAAYRLDDEMAKIRSEIIEAQKETEMKTQLVKEILDKITQLHFSAKTDEAEHLNKQFYEIYSGDNIEKLYNFNKQLSVLTELYRVHGDIL